MEHRIDRTALEADLFATSLPDLIAKQVEYRGDHDAVVIGDVVLSYHALGRRAAQIQANLLEALGSASQPVGVFLGKSLDQAACFLGILAAGKYIVPLDPNDRDQRLERIIQNVDPSLIVTDRASFERCQQLVRGQIALTIIDDLREVFDVLATRMPVIDPDSLATILFTSGSTGEPKGVTQTHRNWLNAVTRYAETLHLDASDRLFRPGSLGFAAGVRALFGALVFGAALITDDSNGDDLGQLVAVLARQRVDLLHTPVNVFRLILEQGASPSSLPALRSVFVAGDALHKRDAQRFIDRFHGHAQLIHALAMTECATAAEWVVDASLLGDSDDTPLGYALKDTEIMLLDEQHQPVAPGAVGLIAVRSRYLSPGYWKRDELTQASFIPDPSGSDIRVYVPGDEGRIDQHGLLRYLGRRDSRVKIHGYQVELRRVNNVLANLDEVRDCAVLAQEHNLGEKRMIAYVAKCQGVELTTERIRARLAQQLPSYMLPEAVVFLDAIPRSAHGKLDTRRLPTNISNRPELSTPFIAPRSAFERRLAEIWSPFFSHIEIGVDDNFFELGGHSLLAARLIANLSSVLGIDIPIRTLLEAPTISALAIALQTIDGNQHRPHEARIDRNHHETGPLSLSFPQQRLWFLERLEPELTAYNLSYGWLVRGHVNAEALSHALVAIVRRHPALRTTFHETSDGPVQIIEPEHNKTILLTESNATSISTTSIAHRMDEEANKPFDLTCDPMLRARLVHLGHNEHLLLLTLHHIASDGWSMRVLLTELQLLYASYSEGLEPTLPALPLQYSDYAQWQRRSLTTGRLEYLTDYWRQELEAWCPLELPTDHPRPTRQRCRGGREPLEIDEILTHHLTALAQNAGVTLHTVLLAGFMVLMSRIGRSQDLCIGIPTAGRVRQDLEGLIGCFINTLVIRARPTPGKSFRDFLWQVWQTCLSAYEHQNLPFEKLVEVMNPDRHLSRPPLAQVLFQYSTLEPRTLALPGLDITPLERPEERARYDLEIDLLQCSRTIRGGVVYNRDLFEPESIRRLCQYYLVLLRGIVESPDQHIDKLSLLSEHDEQTLFKWSHETSVPYPKHETIQELFEARARRSPHHVALVFETRMLTYGELNEAANRVAHALIERGIGADTPVPICVERSLELIIGLLGVLKAGGAYVPLNPDDPEARLTFLLKDSGAPLLLATTRLSKRLPEFTGPRLDLDDLDTLGQQPTCNPGVRCRSEQLAYIAYTSGSTGQPKGVEIPHRAVLRLVHDSHICRLGPDRVFLQFASPSFDAATFEIWGALLHGSRLVVAPHGHQALDRLASIISEHRVTTAWLTAGLFNRIVDTDVTVLQGIEDLLIGGEVLSPNHVTKALQVLSNTAIINGYGPTENTTFTSTYRIPVEQDQEAIPIGRPIANTRVYILDEHLKPQPIGIPGELWVGGDGLARGYFHRPTLTAERFVEVEVFGRRERLYRTGDLARWRSDGNLEFLGRLDHQIKIRGFRIEPGEIEGFLQSHPDVGEAFVIAHEDHPGDKRLVAYVVPKKNGPDIGPALRRALTKQLPDYMIPTAFVALDALPLTPNGKVDHKALPKPPPCVIHSSASDPQDLLEMRLLQIWMRLFKNPTIGVEDNFFELGGHSLLAVQFAADAEQLLGKQVPIASLFHASTIRSLADLLRKDLELAPWTSLVPLQPCGSKPPFYFVHGVGGHVYPFVDLAQRLDPDQPIYGIQTVDCYGDVRRHTSVEAMAAHYVEEIRSFQPEGPYYLGSHSNGGWIAYEMAQQLIQQGQTVRMLALLDTYPLCRIPLHLRMIFLPHHVTRRLIHHVRHIRTLSAEQLPDYLKGRWDTLSLLLWKQSHTPSSWSQTAAQEPSSLTTDYYYYRALTHRYRPIPLPCAIDLFASAQMSRLLPWMYQYFARGGVRVHRVEGDHAILAEEHIDGFVDSFQSALKSAQERFH